MDDPTTNPVAAERRNAVVDALTGREPPGLASEAVTAAYAEPEPAPDVPWSDARLFQLRDVLAVTEERAHDLDAAGTNDEEHDAASSLRDAARELARVVRSLDEQLSAGADLPVDWRPRAEVREHDEWELAPTLQSVTMHRHRYSGMNLTHDHDGGGERHGYYEHPEDGARDGDDSYEVRDSLGRVVRNVSINGDTIMVTWGDR